MDKENFKSMLWMVFLSVFVIWTLFESPLSFSLGSEISEHNLWWEGLFCLFFSIDIYLRWNNKLCLPENTVHDGLGVFEPHNQTTYQKTSWFYIDLITTIPFDMIAYFSADYLPASVIMGIRLLRISRLVKLRSLWTVLEFFPKPVKLGFFVFTIMMAIHWIACGWMIINPRSAVDDFSFYIVSLYWSVTTLTTVGYGDITPVNNIARIYTMGVMLIGVGVYGVIIGNISRLMLLADKYTQERKEKLANLHQYMKHYNIPHSLQRQVFSFYNHLLTKNITHEDSKIINDLPQALQNELNIYTKIKLIKNVHIFKDCSTPCLKLIAEKLEQTFHSPNEYIIRKGDTGEEMFIIGHGEVVVTSGEKVLSELKSGQFFGEIALIENTIRNADVQTKAYCDLYTFNKEDFLEVISKYPHLGEKFNDIYKKRSTDTFKKAA